jgi:ribonuclease D
MKGWRREVFGDAALGVKHGRLAFAFDPQKDRLALIDVPEKDE